MMKKIVHLMKDFSDREGILFVPAQISCAFKKYLKETHNIVLVTKSIGALSKVSREIKVNLPTIVHVPNFFSAVSGILKFKPEIVIIHQHFGSFFETFLQMSMKISGIKTVVGPDLVKEHFVNFEYKAPKEMLKNIGKYILMFLQLRWADYVFCRTKNETDLIFPKMPVSKDKFCIIPPGHDFEISAPSMKDDYLLAVSGWWSDRKNLHTILKVFSEVVKQKECKLIVVGKFTKGKYKVIDEDRHETGEEYKQKVMKLVEELKLRGHVRFVGVKKGKELQELYQKAFIYYMPSKSEGFGTVWIEAMASGTPIVAMKNSAVQYIVRDGAIGFLRNTKKGQEEAILTLLNDSMLYKRMQRNCLKEAERYKWKNVIKEWGKLLIGLA